MSPSGCPQYEPDGGLHAELRNQVRDYFEATAQAPRGPAAIWRKAAALGLWFAVSYLLLVFAADSAWQAVLLAVSLGLAMAGIGFSVMHDGSHASFSSDRRANRAAAFTLDLLGGSSYVWRFKHVVVHHTWPNVAGVDDDIDAGPLARLTPEQPRRAVHRFQHLYMWPLYSFLAVKWHFVDDFVFLATGRIGSRRFARPRGLDLGLFLGGKVVFFTWAFAIPLTRHSLGAVTAAYLGSAGVLGLALSIVFQLAHCVPIAVSAVARPSSWAERQVESAVDFGQGSRFLAWYLGGLNFQIEHHLFPGISHVHYPALAPLVEAACRRFSVRYSTYASFGAALAAHFRHLRRLGQEPDYS